MTRSLQLPFKRPDASAAEDAALVWDPATGRVQVSRAGAFEAVGAANVHSHVIADTTGLQAALDGKAPLAHTHVIADTTGLQAALDAKADDATAVTAGAGLIGGGTLGAAIDLALGTPGALSSSTANAVTADSHTHDIDQGDVVSAGMAGLAAGGVGTYAFLRYNTLDMDVVAGTTYVGSNLSYAGVISTTTAANGFAAGATLGGTWRCMGQATSGPTQYPYTLFLRVL